MAATTLLKIKSNPTKNIKNILSQRTEYIENETKTNNKEYVSSYGCSPGTAAMEFALTKNMYEQITGRETKKDNDILAYHIRQAFKPEDNITPEKAHEIGIQLADEFLKGKHEYVIATHIDKNHIHNHIIFNSTTIDSTHKFNNFYNSSYAIRNISDRLCIENELSVIKSENEKGKHYKEWQEDNKGNSWKSQLKSIIDDCINKSKTYEEFLQNMKNSDCEIKEGKNISFKLKTGQTRFTRGKTIGKEYDKENIEKRIFDSALGISKLGNKKIRKLKSHNKGNSKKVPFTIKKRIIYTIRKQSQRDIKELSKVLLTLRSENINRYKDIDFKIEEIFELRIKCKDNIKILNDEKIERLKILKYMVTYNENKAVIEEYKSTNTLLKKIFYKKNENKIKDFEFAEEQLQLKDINPNEVSIEKLGSLITFIDYKIGTLSNQLKDVDNHLNEIRKVKSEVDIILEKKVQKDRSIKRENLMKGVEIHV